MPKIEPRFFNRPVRSRISSTSYEVASTAAVSPLFAELSSWPYIEGGGNGSTLTTLNVYTLLNTIKRLGLQKANILEEHLIL